MIKKMSKSFVPFLTLLLALMMGTHYLDVKALENSKLANVILVSNSDQENVFEDAIDNDDVNSLLKQDSLFIVAVNYYASKKYKNSYNLFKQLKITYPEESTILRYIGSIQYKRNQFKKSEESLIKGLDLNPNDGSIHAQLGVLYAKTGKNKRAEKHYLRAIELDPNKKTSILNYGILLIKNRKYHHVASLMNSVINESSGKIKAKALYYKGFAIENLGDSNSAIELYNLSIDYYPQYSLPRIQLALLSPDNFAKEEGLKKVLLLNENNSSAHYHLAKFYHENGNIKLAEKHGLTALKLNPTEHEYAEFMSEFLIEQNRLVEAKTILGDLFIGDSLNPMYLFYEGKLAYKSHNYQLAHEYYSQAIIHSDSSLSEAFLNRGNIRSKTGNKEGAINDYKTALSLKGTYSEAYYNLGSIYSSLNNTEKAIAYYDSTLSLNPDYSKAWFNKGKLYSSMENWTSAIECYKSSLKSKPNYLKALLNLGVAYSKNDQIEQSISTYESLIELYPNYVKAHYNLGLNYKRNKDLETAKTTFETALSIDQDHQSSQYALLDIYQQLGEFDDKKNLLISMIESNSEDLELRNKFAEFYLDQKDYKNATSQYEKIIQIDPYYENAYSQLQLIYSDLKPNKEKELQIEALYMKYFPDNERIYELARSYHKRKEYAKAIELYTYAIDEGKTGTWAHYWKGKALESNNQIKLAGNEYIKALKIDKKHKYSLYRMGMLQDQYGDKEKAIKYFDRLIKYYPEFATSKNIQLPSKNQ